MKPKKHTVAGGVVFDDAGRFLVIAREVMRDGQFVHEVRLPKGHIDTGESAEEAAKREVCEESGFCDLEIVADLGDYTSDYTYEAVRRQRLERYFLMRWTGDEPRAAAPCSQEEALFLPEWLSPQDAAQQMTYPSERIFVERAREAWEKRKSS